MAAAAVAPAAAGFIAGGKDFFTFPSIDGAHLLAKIEKLAPKVCADAEWIAVEKVHGSNFSVTFGEDSDEVTYASRNGYLADSAKFFNHLAVLKPHIPAIKALVAEIRSTRPGVRVQLFGELFGTAVQIVNAVYYSPAPADFIAFDLFIAGVPQSSAVLRSLCEKHGVPVLKVLHTGKLAELLKLEPAFESQVRLHLGHELPKEFVGKPNQAEGYVLSPAEPVTVQAVAEEGGALGSVRIMCKHKNPAHMEVKFKLVKPPKPVPYHHSTPWEEIAADVQAIVLKARAYVTMNRLGNYLSKQGEFDSTKAAKYVAGLVQDAYIDLQKDVDAAEKALLAKQQFIVRSKMTTEAQSVLDELVASLKK